MDEVDWSYKAHALRELHQLVYLLNVQSLAMRLDRADWAIISHVMLSLVVESL